MGKAPVELGPKRICPNRMIAGRKFFFYNFCSFYNDATGKPFSAKAGVSVAKNANHIEEIVSSGSLGEVMGSGGTRGKGLDWKRQ